MTDSMISISVYSYFATREKIKRTIASISNHIRFLLKVPGKHNKFTYKVFHQKLTLRTFLIFYRL